MWNLIERVTSRSMAILLRGERMTVRQRFRSPTYSAFFLTFLVVAFVAGFSLPDYQSMGGAAVLALAISSGLCAVSGVCYWAPLFRFPFNPLGYLLLSGEASLSGMPSDRRDIRESILAEWRSRFGEGVTATCERVWQLGRQAALARSATGVVGLCLVNSFRPGLEIWVGLVTVACLACAVSFWSMSVGAVERAKQQIARSLGVKSVAGFPPLNPAAYAVWLERVGAHREEPRETPTETSPETNHWEE